ncbi:MAG: 3'(2'),5'-bisphosphate nucleotidase CysQ [Nitratireductor sp.]|nr:3'(2'),5'-bisphosphate nucleotidase CysQ [Nitratireductor sp.]
MLTHSHQQGRRLTDFALPWMREASEIAMRHYATIDAGSGVMTKDDNSPLTLADLEIDRLIAERLESRFAGIPVVTEEQASSHATDAGSGMFFLVDPLDGTREFISKRDEFTVNIALLENGTPVAGIVAAPALGCLYCGVAGEGAEKIDLATGERSAVSVAVPDNAALRVVASRSHLTEETRIFIEANLVAATKNAGSSLKFCLLAAGEADLYPRFGPTMEWDTAAGHAVLAAAGGHVTDVEGNAFTYGKPEYRNGWFIAASRGVEYTLPDVLRP